MLHCPPVIDLFIPDKKKWIVADPTIGIVYQHGFKAMIADPSLAKVTVPENKRELAEIRNKLDSKEHWYIFCVSIPM